MANQGVPVAQNAYQSVVMKSYANAWTPYVRTFNRYFAGPPGPIVDAEVGSLGAPCLYPLGPRNKGARFFPVGGNAVVVTRTAGGAGYVVGDTITMQPINGGRPIVVKVATAPAGVVGLVDVIDPGSGLVAGGAGVNALQTTGITVVQASTSGAGVGATFVGPGQGAFAAIGWPGPQPNPTA